VIDENVTQIDKEILDFLNQNGVGYEVRQHEPVYTSPQMAKYLETDEERIAKSMILKRSDGGYLLAVLPGRLKIDFARLATALGVEATSLAPIPEAEKLAKCPVGCVHPFGNLLGLRTYFEKHLLDNDYVFFNPGSHTRSVKISTSDLARLVEPAVLDFAKRP